MKSCNTPCSRACATPCGSDEVAGFVVSADYTRFSQKFDVFSRSFWDPSVDAGSFYESYRRALSEWRHVDGYQQRDFALRNAGWHVADHFAERLEAEDRREGFLDYLTAHHEGAEERRTVESPHAMAAELKRAAKIFGADLVGITLSDERWHYSQRYSQATAEEVPCDLPEGLTSVVVVCHEMPYSLLRTVPSALSGAATGIGYSNDVVTLLALAQYIRNLGYRACASMNDTATSIPYAIKAGLGEYGRHGLLITKEFGPRVRIGKIFTDLPLSHDAPIKFGVREFCEKCRRCSKACPPKAISPDEPSDEVHGISNVKGVTKWTTNAEKCFGFWVKQVTDCSICVRVCPYNRDYPRWLRGLIVRLMGSFLRGWMLSLDSALGGGKRKAPKWWWSRGSTE